jgi:hypothetical protein
LSTVVPAASINLLRHKHNKKKKTPLFISKRSTSCRLCRRHQDSTGYHQGYDANAAVLTHAAAVMQIHRNASVHCCADAQHRATLARRQHRRGRLPGHGGFRADAPLNTKNLIAAAIDR